MSESTLSFYRDLPVRGGTLSELYDCEGNFQPVPDDWHLVLVDIQQSTLAVDRGLHYEVNLAATGSIITVHKILRRHHAHLDIPYFFGGDGASFLLPDSVYVLAQQALETYRHHVKRSSGLVLRVGSVPVHEVYETGNSIRMARFQFSDKLVLPVVLGMGIKRAEKRIKDTFVEYPQTGPTAEAPDLTGMECRWDEIRPPESEGRIVCLLVECSDESRQGMVYHRIAKKMTELFGTHLERRPISKPRLRLTTSLQSIRREMMHRLGRSSRKYLLRHWVFTLFGSLYFKFSEEGRAYFDSIPDLSHTVMLDGSFNTVFSGKPDQIELFTEFLNELERTESLQYGLHITYGSIMCCYVEDRKEQHQHFVDGTEGGYTSAAKIYKEKRDQGKSSSSD